MKRTEFVLVYRLKSEPENIIRLHCLACTIYKGPKTNGQCGGLSCAYPTKFNNTKHIPVITMSRCNFVECRADCNRCVMYLKFGVTRNL